MSGGPRLRHGAVVGSPSFARLGVRALPSAAVSDDADLPFATRFWFAFVCLFRVLFDGAFAARAFRVKDGEPEPALPAAPAPAPLPPAPTPEVLEARPAAPPPPAAPALPEATPALQLLALLQREGRLVDFLQEDVSSFPDADIGAAARVVHEGCRKALAAHVELAPVRSEEEGTTVTLPAGFDPASVKLSGDVRGGPPHRGVLRHRGWRARTITLPTPVAGFDATIVAPAEVEL